MVTISSQYIFKLKKQASRNASLYYPMKICGLSDIHGQFRDIPECDVLCITGDIINLNDQRSIDASRHWWYTRFTKWVNRLPCKKVIITPGNHDFFLEDAYNKGYYNKLKQDLSARTDNKLVILINEQCEYEGIKFYGCPYINPINVPRRKMGILKIKV